MEIVISSLSDTIHKIFPVEMYMNWTLTLTGLWSNVNIKIGRTCGYLINSNNNNNNYDNDNNNNYNNNKEN